MNNKQLVNFFKKTSMIMYVGIILIILGGVFVFRRGFGTKAIGFTIMAIGAAIFIVGVSLRASEKDVLSCLAKKMDGMDYTYDTLAVNERRVLRNIKPEVTEYYDYEDGAMFKRAKDGTLISSQKTKSIIFIIKDALIVRTRTVSIFDENVKDRRIEIPFSAITDISVVREEKKLSFMNKTYDVTVDKLVVKYGNGYRFVTPVHADSKSKEIAERLNREIERLKEAAANE